MEIIPITTEFIRLDAALKLSGLVDTGGHKPRCSSKRGTCWWAASPAPCGGRSSTPGTPFPWGIGSFKWPGRRADTLWW